MTLCFPQAVAVVALMMIKSPESSIEYISKYIIQYITIWY